MFVLFGPEVHCLKDFYALRHCYQELECLITSCMRILCQNYKVEMHVFDNELPEYH